MSRPKRNVEESMKDNSYGRADMVARFGFVPLSIIRDIRRGRLSSHMFVYQQEQAGRSIGNMNIGNILDQAKGVQAVANAYARERMGTINIPGLPSQNRTQLSIMPAELVEFFVKYYAKPGDVYLDPFAGQGIQMQVAKILGLHYLGYDLSTEFVAYIESVRKRIDDGKTRLSITHGDSRFPTAIPDGIGDFSFHSPPYWDIEYYGDDPGQLGYHQTYEDFLVGMRDVARAWLPKFKAGAFHVVNVNDFRRSGRFYPYHADTIRIYIEAGWELHDLWVIEGLVGGLPKVFAVDKNRSRISPKVHEYALVFRAPGAKR